MTDETTPRPVRPRPAIVLDPPPAWLADVPQDRIRPGADPHRLLWWLVKRRGIHARPTLAQVEAERARRGMRSLTLRSGSTPARLVLPMGPGISPQRRAALAATRKAA